MFLTAANKCFEKYEEKKTKLKRKHKKMIKEFKEKLKKDKRNRVDTIQNENFKLLSYLDMEIRDLKNEVKILILELEELELPKKVFDEIIEDITLDP